MAKPTRYIVALALTLVGAGAALAITGALTGGLRSVYFGDDGFYLGSEANIGTGRQYESFESFSDIDIDVTAYQIAFREGDGYSVEITRASELPGPDISLEGDRLVISGAGHERSGEPRWVSLMRGTIFENGIVGLINGRWSGEGRRDMVISYPKGAALGNVGIVIGAADIGIYGLKAESLDISCSFGNLYVSGSDFSRLRASLDAGNCELDGVRADTAGFSLNAGSLSSRGLDSGGLEADIDVGGIDIEGTLRGDTRVSAGTGDVRLESGLPESEYDIDLDVSIGVATIDGDRTPEGGFRSGGGAENSLSVSAALGSVYIKFGGR
ncbi:MAG: DUF4097 domain-containing protein [Clostridiales Family XIII bacterium]|jgi:hypothetical protein|nr:DUF4097 domain-containing protein [Clostridiales Family XIII bacterium]